jgi:hypothetical protein
MIGFEPVLGSASSAIAALIKDDPTNHLLALRRHILSEYEEFVSRCQQLTGAYLSIRAVDTTCDPTRILFDDHTAAAPLLSDCDSAHDGAWKGDVDGEHGSLDTLLGAGARQYVALGDEPARKSVSSYEARLVEAANAAFAARADVVSNLGKAAEHPLQVCAFLVLHSVHLRRVHVVGRFVWVGGLVIVPALVWG